MAKKNHPMHLMLVHFSIALFPASLVCDVLDVFYPGFSFYEAGFYALTGALVMAVPTILSGIYDLIRWKADKSEMEVVVKKAIYHGSLQFLISAVFMVLWIKQMKGFPEVGPVSITVIIIKIVLVLLMFGANYLGGDLVVNHLHKKASA